tara:strand:+ start:649 stop:753 length:105 start_codon:yes stop_codon:yes gene_type:complete
MIKKYHKPLRPWQIYGQEKASLTKAILIQRIERS